MATIIPSVQGENSEAERSESARLTAHSARFFHPKSLTESAKEPVVPLGLKFAKEMNMSPNQAPTCHSSATQTPTPRGDSNGDIGMDIDL